MFKSRTSISVRIAVSVMTFWAGANISAARADPIIIGSEADFLAAVGDVEREGFQHCFETMGQRWSVVPEANMANPSLRHG
jgi:hypothetical protein